LLLLGLLIIQACFWAVDLGLVDSAIDKGDFNDITFMQGPAKTGPAIFIKVADDNAPIDDEVDQLRQAKVIDGFIQGSFSAWNFMLIFVSLLYCLSLLMGIKISLAGGLGGLADLTRAFFLSLVFMIIVIPWWQGLIEMDTNLVVFNYGQLMDAYTCKNSQTDLIFYYGRFTGFWLLGLLLLVIAQSKSHRGSRSIILRLTKNIEPPAPADASLIDL